MILSKLEYEQLRIHLREKPFFWSESPDVPGLWLRSVEGESCFGLQFLDAGEVIHATTTPLGWDGVRVEAFLLALLEHWTTYSRRRAVEKVLTELQVPEAELIALALDGVVPDSPSGPAPDLPLPFAPLPSPDAFSSCVFQVVGGGYVRLQQAGHLLEVTLSIPTLGGKLTFGSPFSGFVQTVVWAHAGHTLELAERVGVVNAE